MSRRGWEAGGEDNAAQLPSILVERGAPALSLSAWNLGNLWRRLVLPGKIENWSLTSMQHRLVKTLEMRHFRIPLYPEEPGLAPPGRSHSFIDEKNVTNSSQRCGWMYTRHQGQDGKIEILG
jgi:hypothetical protein